MADSKATFFVCSVENLYSAFNSRAEEDSLCTSQPCQVHGYRQSGLYRYAASTGYILTLFSSFEL